ncbi:MAG: hypothetical protein QGI33_07505, partial [Candidatus Brocadiia bacterium]|nr:hypothetical protein [Candidatus Brocadiia bacterium]
KGEPDLLGDRWLSGQSVYLTDLSGFGPAGALSGKSRAGHWRTLEYERSLFSRKFVLDTTAATVEESLGEFMGRIKPFITADDRLRMLSRAEFEDV